MRKGIARALRALCSSLDDLRGADVGCRCLVSWYRAVTGSGFPSCSWMSVDLEG